MGTHDALQVEPVFFKDTFNPSSRQTSRIPRNVEARKNDPQYDFHFRSDRVFSVGHEWYFSTREDIDFGPFRNKERAQDALQTFLMLVA